MFWKSCDFLGTMTLRPHRRDGRRAPKLNGLRAPPMSSSMLWRSLNFMKHSSHHHNIIDHIIDPCWSNEFTLLELGWRRWLYLLCFWYLVNLVSADRVEPRQGISTNRIESYHPEILRYSSDLEATAVPLCVAPISPAWPLLPRRSRPSHLTRRE